jgi:hypothetical protein
MKLKRLKRWDGKQRVLGKPAGLPKELTFGELGFFIGKA